MYARGDYDLAGFCVGIAEKDDLITPDRVRPGDVLIALASSGPHSNGYSLIRKVLEVSGADPRQPLDGSTLGELLMAPTRIYVKPVLAMMERVRVRAMAHITGGGLVENLPRVLPNGVKAVVDLGSWHRPAIFDWLQSAGWNRRRRDATHLQLRRRAGPVRRASRGAAGLRRLQHRRRAALGLGSYRAGRTRAGGPGTRGAGRGTTDVIRREPETSPPLAVVVLVSGSGSNLQALIDAQRSGLNIIIRGVVSNVREAFALQRARDAGIPGSVLDHRGFPSREAYDAALAELIDGLDPGLVVLAGFMRILTPDFVVHYRGRILNIHPSLLPKFRGLHTHGRALEAGERVHGASVHFVTPELDGGPVVLRAEVPVLPGDDTDTLATRVLEREHIIYPCVVGWFAAGRLHLDVADRPVLDGEVLTQPLLLGGDAPCPGQSA